MAVTGDTQVGALKQAMIGELVQREIIAKGVVAQSVTNVSQYAVKGAKSIGFPKAGSFTVENRASGAQATIQNLTFGLDSLDLNQRATVAWIIDNMDEQQVALDLQGVYAVRAAAAHAKNVDAKIIAELDNVAQEVSGSGALTDANLLAVRTALIKNEADRTNMRLLLSADSEAQMLAIDKFVRADAYGSAVIPNGLLGRYYGMDTYVSTQVTDGTFYAYDASAVAIGFQKEPTTDERKAPEYGSNSILKVMDMLFGVKGLQLGVNGAASGKSALVWKFDAGADA